MFCHNCGKQIPDDTRFCHYCGVAQDGGQSASASAAPPPVQPQPTPRQTTWQAQPQQAPQQTVWQAQSQSAPQQTAWQAQSQASPQQTAGQERERVLPGVLGAFLCSLVGVVVMVVLHRIGFVSSLSGIIMLVCTVWGYTHFSKVMSRKGVVFSVLIVILMIYVGNRINWAFIFLKNMSPSASVLNVFHFFRILPNVLNNRMTEHYQNSLFQQYAYAAAGMIFLGIYLVRGNRSGKKK